jgi:hypothetical protein
MTRTIALTAMSAALVLAACSKDPAEPASEASASVAEQAEQAEPSSEAAASEPAAVEAASPTPAPTPTPSATETVAASEIPKGIRGRWGLVPADCTRKLGDAKGLLTVSAGQLKFYEAVAKLGKVKEAEDGRMRASFNFSGEGQTWALDVVLDVQDGGKTLIRRDYGKDALPGPLKYTRCT